MIACSIHNTIYLNVALKTANDKFSEKLLSGKSSSDKEMLSLCWSVDELGRLNESGRKLRVEIDALLVLFDDPSTDFIHQNIARRLATISYLLSVVSPDINDMWPHMFWSQ